MTPSDDLVRAVEATLFAAEAPMTVKALSDHLGGADVRAALAELAGLYAGRGIELVEQRTTDVGDFSSMITADVVTQRKTSSASGTLFGNNMPFIDGPNFNLPRKEMVDHLFRYTMGGLEAVGEAYRNG